MSLVRQTLEARQHGAMEGSVPPTDLDAVRLYRLGRVREALKERDYAGILLYDQVNTRYATDVTNMQIWCLHNEARFVFVPTEGPVIAWEYGSVQHLAEGVPTIDEIRPAKPFFYFATGARFEEKARLWADEIADVLRQHGGGNKRLAVDRVAYVGLSELLKRDIEIFDGFELMENAREIKSEGEIALMRRSIEVCELGMQAMREALEPGITENGLWAKLHEANIANGGEWIETRILSSGPRTNPWFRESSLREIQKGDIMSFDTDLIGPYGYCADISRSWVCGDVPPSNEQSRLHGYAVEQINHNKELLQPGASFKEVSEKAWDIPSEFQANRYGSLIHGVGLADEYPSIKHWPDFEEKGYDGILRPGMVLCVESYIGSEGGSEGVKLEEQVLITEDGNEQLSTYPIEIR